MRFVGVRKVGKDVAIVTEWSTDRGKVHAKLKRIMRGEKKKGVVYMIYNDAQSQTKA